jgi:hypothetical protein
MSMVFYVYSCPAIVQVGAACLVRRHIWLPVRTAMGLIGNNNAALGKTSFLDPVSTVCYEFFI